MRKFLYWLPRILSILFIGFISMFALDVFEGTQCFWALMMHLIPSFILIILTGIAWEQEILGGILFIIAGFTAIHFFNSTAFIIYAPVFVIGILFLFQKYLLKNLTQ